MLSLNQPVLVLMYHRVNRLRPDPWDSCVSPEHFEQHLQVIRSIPIPTRITLDDGYADNYTTAKPLLERYDLPATIFVTSGAVDSRHEMWWDELDRRFLLETPKDWNWSAPDPDAGAVQYRRMFELARRGEYGAYPIRPIARPERRMMTSTEVADLARGGLIEIGSHTVSHPVLSQLDQSRQRSEIVQSKRDLEAIVGGPITSFAYPNGFPADYTEETVRLVKEAGYQCAYSGWDTDWGTPIDLYQIPRMMVRDWDGDHFEKFIQDKLHNRISV